MSDNTREAFEVWAKSKGIRTERDAFGRYIDGQQHWAGWQAAWPASRLQAIEECAKAADRLAVALDHGGNEYRREASASQVAAAIRNLTHSEDGKA